MSLLDNLNAFRNKVKTAPVLSSKTAKSVSPPTTAKSTTSMAKRRYEEDDEDEKEYKRPMSDSSSNGTHLSTQLHLAVTYIKEKDSAIPVDDMLSYLNINDKGDRSRLINLLIKLDKIKYDDNSRMVEYVSIHNIKSKDGLLIFLRAQKTFKGISCKELKDGWSGCLEAIDELESQGKIVVLRTKKDGAPKFVWSNDGGPIAAVDEEFVSVWQSVKLPERAELPGMLSKLGLKPASVDPATIKNDNSGTDLKKRKQRKGKITNTHMTGILKDYSTQ